MKHRSQVREQPLRWLVRAMATGAGIGILVGVGLGGRSMLTAEGLSQSALVGLIFCLVMWAGFDLFANPFRDPPAHWSAERVGLLSVAWILLLFPLLLGLSILLVRLLTGASFVHNRLALAIAALSGLAASGIIATKETIQHQVRTARALSMAEARASFLVLQAQLHPHTLFNALNTIAALIKPDPERAEEATERLAALLRRILGALERPQWPLSEEFALLEDLLRLEQLRFGERLSCQLSLDPAMADRELPPLLVLPLVENALKHGFRPKIGTCRLQVIATDGSIRVEDDGVGRAPDATEGVGLRTVRDRIEALGGSLRWPPCAEGCAATLVLP